jgi:hypothetical protein
MSAVPGQIAGAQSTPRESDVATAGIEVRVDEDARKVAVEDRPQQQHDAPRTAEPQRAAVAVPSYELPPELVQVETSNRASDTPRHEPGADPLPARRSRRVRAEASPGAASEPLVQVETRNEAPPSSS